MQPNNDQQTSKRHRRSERYTAEYVSEPSMSAPQPMPGKAANHGNSSTAAQIPVQPVEDVPVQMEPELQQGWPQQYQQPPVQQGWSQQYQQPPVQQGWSQQYQQPPVQQGWSQQYQQPPVQQGWSQQYQQPPVQQGWSQQYQQPPVQQGWSQPYQPQKEWQPANGYELNAGQMPGNGGNGGGGRNLNWIKMALLAAAAIIVVVLLAIGGKRLSDSNQLHEEVSAYNNRFCQGVYVDGIHLGGMTQQEAIDAVTVSAQQRMQAWNVRLTYSAGEGQEAGLVRTITANDLGMTVHVDEALAEAWEQGHASSDVKERKAAMDALLQENYEGYTALPSGDTSAIDSILHQLASVVYTQPQDAYVSGYDPMAHSYPFVFEPEVNGYYLDIEPIKQELYAMVTEMRSGTIELKPQVLKPSVTEADLRRQRTLRGTALTEISTTSTVERTANIERAFQLINGKVLKPGESFSFNNIVGARSAKNGFHLAIEYAYGNERMAMAAACARPARPSIWRQCGQT